MEINKKVSQLVENLKTVLDGLAANTITFTKPDLSPVTLADLSVQVIINQWIFNHFPEDLIIAEERSSGDTTQDLRQFFSTCPELLDITNRLNPESLLDFSGKGTSGYTWFIDPIDGTKGYIRKEQFAVAISRYHANGTAALAMLICPNLGFPIYDQAEKGTVFYLTEGKPVIQFSISDPKTIAEISTSRKPAPFLTTSVEKSHGNAPVALQVGQKLGLSLLEMDSQAKYGLLIRKEASVYLRYPSNTTYLEKTWDHAAGAALIIAAGGTVTDIKGNPISIRPENTLPAPNGIVASIGMDHNQVLAAIRESAI